jgi:hypothetical protein
VPTISRFYGIDIFMWFNDHEPPHFHARYGAYEAKSRSSRERCCRASCRVEL